MFFLVSGINTVIGIGITFIIVGIMWMVLDAEFVHIRSDYWISTPYLELMNTGVNVFPSFMMLVGIIVSLVGIEIKRRVV